MIEFFNPGNHKILKILVQDNKKNNNNNIPAFRLIMGLAAWGDYNLI